MQHFFSETPGHDSYPIESLIGSLREIMLRKRDPGAKHALLNQIGWQLHNIRDNLNHPNAQEVYEILKEHGYESSNPESLTPKNISTICRELYTVADSIRQRIQGLLRTQ